jgi:hypothetical protein
MESMRAFAKTKEARYNTYLSLCILCQEQTEELRVEKLTAYLKTLAFTRERQHMMDTTLMPEDDLDILLVEISNILA